MQKGTRYGERGICVVLGIDPSDPVILSDKVTIVSTEREVSVLARIHQYLLLSSGSRERFWFFFSSDLCIRVFLGGQNIINEQSTRWFMSSVADSLCLSSSTHTMSCAPTDFHRMREYNKICVKFSAQHCFCLSSAHNIRIIRGGKKLNTFTQAALKAQC